MFPPGFCDAVVSKWSILWLPSPSPLGLTFTSWYPNVCFPKVLTSVLQSFTPCPNPSKTSSTSVFNYHLYIDNLQIDICDFQVHSSFHGSLDLTTGNFSFNHSVLTFKSKYPKLKALSSQLPNQFTVHNFSIWSVETLTNLETWTFALHFMWKSES